MSSKIKDLNLGFDKVERIHHLADIHFRNFSRHKEYETVLNRLYKKINKNANENSLITILGDVAHSKTDMSPELIKYTSEFLTKLESIRPVLLIPGNHDDNILNSERMDALTPIVENLNLDDLRYIKEPGLFRVGDTVFSHFSIYGENSDYVPASEIPNEYRKVALYHGTVDRSVTDQGYVLKNKDMTEMKFVNFHAVLLGDIHRRQKVSEYDVEEMVVEENELEKYLNSGWSLAEEEVERENDENPNKNEWFE